MDHLDILDGHGRRRRVELGRPRLVIGREPTCDIYLPHPSVSRRHAQLQQTEQGLWLLQDLQSLNHVYLGEQPVQQVLLQPGVRVRIAEYHLTLAPPEAPGPEQDAASTVELAESAWTDISPGWLEHLQGFQRALLRLDEPGAVLERLAQEFRRIARPDLVAIGLSLPDDYRWEVVKAERGAASPPPADLFQRRASLDESSVQSWNGESSSVALGGPTAHCFLFPMKGRSGTIGHVYVERPCLLPLPAAVRRYLALLATQAGLAWDNLQLGALRLARKVIEQELRQARQIQTELFPATTDLDERLCAFAVNLPSVHVSGDYYDLIRTGPDTVAFVIADAMGHGMPAALMMAAVRASLRMGLHARLSWPALFGGVDSIIAQARAGAYVTGLLGQIDLKARKLFLVSAGHHLPSVLVDGKPAEVPKQCRTRPWGLDFPSEWEVGEVPLAGKDWSVVCFTDGISEAPVQPRGTFGARRVAAYHARNAHLSAEDLCQGLIGEVAKLQGTATLADDQTVLVLRAARRPG
ncbi:MAG TPA: SpoIIE family protein phosphatase [Gemmataceae bacterium]|nr:SpoIIE family protein phosphatase [Gemmataceae bacterium]